jgi:hypothetical protein
LPHVCARRYGDKHACALLYICASSRSPLTCCPASLDLCTCALSLITLPFYPTLHTAHCTQNHVCNVHLRPSPKHTGINLCSQNMIRPAHVAICYVASHFYLAYLHVSMCARLYLCLHYASYPCSQMQPDRLNAA